MKLSCAEGTCILDAEQLAISWIFKDTIDWPYH